MMHDIVKDIFCIMHDVSMVAMGRPSYDIQGIGSMECILIVTYDKAIKYQMS